MSEAPAPPAVPLHKMSVLEQLLLARKYSHEVAFIEKVAKRIEAAEAEVASLRSDKERLERVERAARLVLADTEEFPYDESGFGDDDYAMVCGHRDALAATLSPVEGDAR